MLLALRLLSLRSDFTDATSVAEPGTESEAGSVCAGCRTAASARGDGGFCFGRHAANASASLGVAVDTGGVCCADAAALDALLLLPAACCIHGPGRPYLAVLVVATGGVCCGTAVADAAALEALLLLPPVCCCHGLGFASVGSALSSSLPLLLLLLLCCGWYWPWWLWAQSICCIYQNAC